MKKLTRLEALFLNFLVRNIDRLWNNQPVSVWRKNILETIEIDKIDIKFIKDMGDEDFSQSIRWGMLCFTLQDLGLYDLLLKIWPEETKQLIPSRAQISSVITFDPQDGKVNFVSKDEYIRRKLEGKTIIQFEKLIPSGCNDE